MNQTINNERIIGENNLQEMHNHVNLSHAVHMEMRGDTGGAITFGMGVLMDKSSKQKMN